MDYLRIYNDQYNFVFDKIKAETIDKLKVAKKNKKNFTKSFNKIINDLYEKRNQIHKKIEDSNLNTCLNLFDSRYDEYDNNLPDNEVILLIFSNEILDEYNKLGHKNYELFIKDLAELNSTTQTQIHFRNYFGYYELVFDQEKYSFFYGKKFENLNYENSSEYKEMLDFKYPERIKNRVKQKEIRSLESKNNSKINISIKNKPSIISTRDRLKDDFNTKERAILIDLLKNRLDIKSIDTTLIIKLALIIGATDKFEIFENKKASEIYLYKQVLLGFEVFKKSERDGKIANLKNKLNTNGLKFISEELQMHYSDYLLKKTKKL